MRPDAARTIDLIYNTPGQPSDILTTQWVYDQDDPYAITTIFLASPDEHDENIAWTYSRDLAITGIDEPAGDGDVRFAPYDDDEALRNRFIAMKLASIDGEADFLVPRPELVLFIRATQLIVPQGQESAILKPKLDRAADLLIKNTGWFGLP